MRVVTSLTYFTPSEIEQLTSSTGVTKSSTSVKRQSHILGFLQALSSRIGFPQRTIATSQLLYLRFHLFYNPSDFITHEVGIACLVVAAKMNDTPKKSREVILSSWALRYPELVRSVPLMKASNNSPAKSLSNHTGSSTNPAVASQSGLGVISESDIDVNVLEVERKRILTLESLILRSIAFEFNMRTNDNLLLTAKLARRWKAGKELASLAWQVAADCHRTYAPLTFPPSIIAAASVYTASLLSQRCLSPSSACSDIIRRFQRRDDAEDDHELATLCCPIDGVEDVVHTLLDLYGAAISSLPSSSSSSSGITPVSPATPASPSEGLSTDTIFTDSRNPNASRKLPPHVFSPPPFGVLHWKTNSSPCTTADMLNDLTQMKISLRKNEEERDSRQYKEKSSIVRIFDKGGIRGDVDKSFDKEVEISWREREQDKQYQALQRFLF